ncbi:hypothetical protein [Winogradskyella sp. A2]|uniref:hypothetical protein n=1 Tax=Winogradskyella sp. A2 TaxID=3366944 RepID=UPI00398C3C0F
MRQYLYSILLLLFSIQITSAQILKAKVYDATTTVKGIKVYNKTQKRITATDDEGNFSLPAKVGDSIKFQSLFHHPKTIAVSKSHFRETTIFELKKIINELDVVEIESEPKQPVFVLESYNTELQDLIKEDIKRNPHLYTPEGASYGVDFVYLIGQIAKLFKNKNKYRTAIYQPLSYRQLDSLFSNSTLFNERLVHEDLNIPTDKTKLFFDFCTAQQISSELLKEKKQMELLELLMTNSKNFLAILDEFEKTKLKKD